jgi:hypothetical protein
MQLKSSILLFYYSPASEINSEFRVNEYLVSGLLSAINSFSEVELEGKGIESVDMGESRWVYLKDTRNNLLLVAAGSKLENSGVMRSRLEVIKKMFIEQYHIDGDYWDKGPVEISQFDRFSIVVQTLYDQWIQAEKVMDVGVVFDLLGIYQQIFIKLIKIVNDHFTGLQYKIVLAGLFEYEQKVKDFIQGCHVPDCYHMIENFIPVVQLNQNKIFFNDVNITDVFGTNPVGLDPQILRPLFAIILKQFRDVISDALGETRWIKLFTQEIKPVLIGKWDFLEKMALIKDLVLLFLN